MKSPNTRPLGYGSSRKPQPEPPAPRRSTARHTPPPNETKRDRFLRLLTARMKNSLTCIRLIGNLANRDVYKYEDEDIAHVKRTLHIAIDEALGQFAPQKRNVIKFELPAKTTS